MRTSIAFRLLATAVLAASGLSLVACGDQSATVPDAPADTANGQTAAGDAAKGEELFVTCGACHGPDAKGLPNLGKDLTTSEWTTQQSDEELVAFLKVGREAGDPLNTTGVAMPPKGGNPVLTDDDLVDLVAYLRAIHVP